MKLVGFVASGRSGYGALMADGQVADLSASWGNLRSLLPNLATGEVAAAVRDAPILAASEFQLAIPVSEGSQIICAGLNFRAHAAESGVTAPAKYPSIFLRSASTFVAQEQPIYRPKWCATFDYEAELALVIGKSGRYITPENAMDHVAGYTLLMDGSVREVQFEHSLTAGKNFYRSGSIGPWIVTADEISDPTKLVLIGVLNGEERQRAPISDLIFDIPTLISYASRMNQLEAGDLISVGTPSGVGAGMTPPRYMNEGDVFETRVQGVGVLRNPIVGDPLSS